MSFHKPYLHDNLNICFLENSDNEQIGLLEAELASKLIEMNTDMHELIPQESKVSRILNHRTTKIVILIVLTLLLFLPLFNRETYFTPITGQEYGVEEIIALHQNGLDYDTSIEYMINYYRNSDFPILKLVINDLDSDANIIDYQSDDSIDNYRPLELNVIKSKNYEITISIKSHVEFDSFLKLFKTTMVLIILIIISLLVASDAQKYVLRPLETLISKVRRIAADPFTALTMSYIKNYYDRIDKKKNNDQLETEIIDSKIMKI